MKKSIFVSILFFLFLFLGSFSRDALGQQQQRQLTVPSTIEIIKVPGKPVTLRFTPQELQRVAADPQFLLQRLKSAARNDCTYARRISSCIWACANGCKVRTCDPTLVSALERLWPK